MRFTKIKYKEKEGVELAWTITDANGTKTTTELASRETPTPEFVAALAAFKPFVFGLLGLPDAWRDGVVVSTLSLGEDKETGARGLMVSAVKPIPKASNRPLSITTPHMREAGENSKPDATGVFDEDVAQLIAAAEAAATAYVKGDRSQAEMFQVDKSDPKADANAPADDLSKKRERKRKAAPNAGTPNEVWNPGADTPPTDDLLREELAKADRDVPLDVIASWTSRERDQAFRWSRAMVASAAGTPVALDDLVEPEHVTKGASNNLFEVAKPPKLDDAAVAEIRGSVAAGAE